ncbi:MAG: HAD family hydrolase [Bacteroidia bacterium]
MLVYIFDLDDTLYPVNTIDESVGLPIYNALKQLNLLNQRYTVDQINEIYSLCWKYPIDELAKRFNFPNVFLTEISEVYQNLTVNHKLQTFPDYNIINNLEGDKYLVSTGYPNLQTSKIENLGIKDNFIDIYFDNPISKPRKTKKYFMNLIYNKYKIDPNCFIVVGDNLHSEILYANELKMTSVLFNIRNYSNKHFIESNTNPTFIINNLSELQNLNISKW